LLARFKQPMNKQSIFEHCQQVANDIRGDFGGGSPVAKTFIISYLIQLQNLRHFVEIGIYRGRSIFPLAHSIFLNGGRSVGIDPYKIGDAREKDVEEKLGEQIDSFLDSLDFENIYRDVLEYRERCGYGESIEIVRHTSNDYFSNLPKDGPRFDIAHIDGNHDTKFVRQDYNNCYASMVDRGFIVFDDIDWESVRVVYDEAKKHCPVVFETDQFGILLKQPPSITRTLLVEELSKKLATVYRSAERILSETDNDIPSVSVGILTYNQVDYIKECLDSVFAQSGNFSMKVIIYDDCSNDGTSETIYNYIQTLPEEKQPTVRYYRNDTNVGMVENFKKLTLSLGGSDYFTFCEGDDYYLSSSRISQHIDFQQKNPQFLTTFNRMVIYNQDQSTYEIFKPDNSADAVETKDLVAENLIGNLGCVFYNSILRDNIKPDLFGMFTGDWMLAMFLSQFGSVGCLNKPLNVYRRHSEGIWTGQSSEQKLVKLVDSIDVYSKYLDFTYDTYFSAKKNVLKALITNDIKPTKSCSVAIIDDISPHPISGFRYAEFTAILQNIPRSKLYSTGESTHVLGSDNIDSLVIDYKRKYPELASSVGMLDRTAPIGAELFYCVFLGNAYANVVERAEREETPFIFTLYPGGMFSPGDTRSDDMLRRVMDSPYFKKVIVTQQLTYDYLIDNKFCAAEKIESIWGVVTPADKLNLSIDKKNFGINKSTLDICFVAHKYSEHGEDKGYDVFLDVARKLSAAYENVSFHIVGPWSADVLSTEGIRNIRFYGVQGQDWFDSFYRKVDIILSPNINGKIFNGSFDGFPTGAATDAALRKVAMFVTDPLHLNGGRFVDGKEVVIIRHDANDIFKTIQPYLKNPKKLQLLGEAGYKKANKLYSKEAQIDRRIKLLKAAAQEAFEIPELPTKSVVIVPSITQTNNGASRLIRKITPRIVKKSIRKMSRLWKKFRSI
jgi:glycosyltransferase involved in cell wall biosynthesis